MEQKDSTSSHKKEVIVITPDQLRKLGISKDSIISSVKSPNSTSPSTPVTSPNIKSNVRTSPIVLNEQVSRHYMKTLYGSSTSNMAPRPATLAKKSFPQPPTIVMSPSKKLVAAEPDILNSKVCLPLRNFVPTTTVMTRRDVDVIDLDEMIETKYSGQNEPKKLIKVLNITSLNLPQHEIRELVNPDKSGQIHDDNGRMKSTKSTVSETSKKIVKQKNPTKSLPPIPSQPRIDDKVLNALIKKQFQTITLPIPLTHNDEKDKSMANLESNEEIREEPTDDMRPPVLESQNLPLEQQSEEVDDDITPPILEPQNAPFKEQLREYEEEHPVSDKASVLLIDKPPESCVNKISVMLDEETSRFENQQIGPSKSKSISVTSKGQKQSLTSQIPTSATITFHMQTKKSKVEQMQNIQSPEAKSIGDSRAKVEKKVPIIKAQIKSVTKTLHVSCIDLPSGEKVTIDKDVETITNKDIVNYKSDTSILTKPPVKVDIGKPSRPRRKPFLEERIIIRVEDDDSPITEEGETDLGQLPEIPVVKRRGGRTKKNSNLEIALNQPGVKNAAAKEPTGVQSKRTRKTLRKSYQEVEEDYSPPKVRRQSVRARKPHLDTDVHGDSTGKSAIENDSAAEPDALLEIENKEQLDKTSEIQNMETPPANTPKKRGRPRKTPVDPNKPPPEKQEKVEEPPVDLESSKSGRKRKKVDYFAMENSFYEIEYGNMNNKRNEYKGQSDSADEKEFEVPKKAKRIRRSRAELQALVPESPMQVSKTPKMYSKTYSNSAKSKPETVLDNGEDDRSSSTNLSKSEPKKYSEKTQFEKAEGMVNNDVLNDNDDASTSINLSTNDDEGISEGSTYVRGRDANDTSDSLNITDMNNSECDTSGLESEKLDKSTRNYVKTGQTKAMIHNVFTAAMKTICDSEIEKGDTEQQQSWSSPIQSRRIGRPPKNANYVDSTGETTCAICRHNVSMVEWVNHNIVEHYNLSWKLGEQPLILEDPKVTLRKLKIAIKQLRQLECKTCAQTFTAAAEYMDHIDKCSGIVATDGKVICVVCKNGIDRNEWQKHKFKIHNNLTWRKGDTPLDLTNQQMVMDILKTALKQKRQLYCYKCQETKKSIVGYLSHIAQCGQKEAKVACKICGRMMLPVSIPPHMKVHEVKKLDKSVPKSHLTDIGTGDNRRRAAQKALNVISSISKDMAQQESAQLYIKQEVFQIEDFFKEVLYKQIMENQKVKCKFKECEQEYDEVDSLLNHMIECEMKPKLWYVCVNCMLVTPDKGEIVEHVLTYFNEEHPEYVVDESEMEEAIYEQILRKRKMDESRMEKYPNFKAKPTFLLKVNKRRKELFSCAFEYTLEFCNEHFTLSELFGSLNYNKSDWRLVEDTQIETYLPKTERSCQVACTSMETYYNKPNTEFNCRTYEIFEVDLDEVSATIFCGGPVYTMAWLPTPHMYLECDQLLAVAVDNTFEAKYKMNANYSEPTGVQFWHFGILKNKYQIPKPQLMCILAMDIGPIWHMEWCPSGCYSQKQAKDQAMKRMGLLAVAGSTPKVLVYAVPFLDENERELVYKVKPLLKLQLCQDEESPPLKHFPTRISWSKASSHKYIAVGYTDGMVGIFDLECTSKLLRYKDKEDGVDVILPYKTIKAHRSCITVLSMIHLKGGKNWLLTGSYDKRVCTWDLNDNTNISYSYKRIPYDGTWMTNWIVHTTVPDSFSTSILTLPATVRSHRDYLSDSTSVMQTISTSMSISASDWLNGLIQGNSTGDISSCFPSQLVCSFDNEKIGDVKHMLACTKLVSDPEADGLQNKMDKNNIMDYQWTTQRYQLLFCDLKLNRYSEAYKQLAAKVKARNETWQGTATQMDLYPMVSVNKVCFNPNCQASLYYAAGYQAGFVRLSYLKFLENDRQVV